MYLQESFFYYKLPCPYPFPKLATNQTQRSLDKRESKVRHSVSFKHCSSFSSISKPIDWNQTTSELIMTNPITKRKASRKQDEEETELLNEEQQEHEIQSLEQSHQLKKSSIKWILFIVGLLFSIVNVFNIYKLGFNIPKAFTLASFLEGTLRVLLVTRKLRLFSLAFSCGGFISSLVLFKEFPMIMTEELVYFPIVLNAVVQLFLSDMISEEDDIDELKQLKYKLKGA